jgi:uncharacterized membrane protein
VLTLTHIFYVLGAMFVGAALLNAREGRLSIAAFWAIVAVPCLAGDPIVAAAKAGTKWPAQAMGVGVLALAVLATRGKIGGEREDSDPAAREASAARLRNRLFAPALAIPVITGVLVVGATYPALHLDGAIRRLIAPTNQASLVALGVASVLALVIAVVLVRARPSHGLTEARRLLDTVGWPIVLPTLLAALGAVFAETGVGKAFAAIVQHVIPTDSALACLLAFGLGMVGFTAIMGNAFAAFPVMMSGIGLPLLVQRHGAAPAALGAIGMLTGYCGTLLTPMAANFNVVPAILLELRDAHGVIRAQWPIAIVMLVANLVLLWLVIF